MSHDRGCFKCGRDHWEYDDCPKKDCVKRKLAGAYSVFEYNKILIEENQRKYDDMSRDELIYSPEKEVIEDSYQNPRYFSIAKKIIEYKEIDVQDYGDSVLLMQDDNKITLSRDQMHDLMNVFNRLTKKQ